MRKYSDTMAAVASAVHPVLKAAGFRKRRHTFNRSAEPGIIQIINFQMGQKMPPGTHFTPGVREDLHGLFTVNVAVTAREAWEQWLPGLAFPRVVSDGDGTFGERLGLLMPEARDIWWGLDADPEQLAAMLRPLIETYALPWLEARATRSAIVEIFRESGANALPTLSWMPIVMILRSLGRHDEAAALLRTYYDTQTRDSHPSHRRYVFEEAARLGIEGLSAP